MGCAVITQTMTSHRPTMLGAQHRTRQQQNFDLIVHAGLTLLIRKLMQTTKRQQTWRCSAKLHVESAKIDSNQMQQQQRKQKVRDDDTTEVDCKAKRRGKVRSTT